MKESWARVDFLIFRYAAWIALFSIFKSAVLWAIDWLIVITEEHQIDHEMHFLLGLLMGKFANWFQYAPDLIDLKGFREKLKGRQLCWLF